MLVISLKLVINLPSCSRLSKNYGGGIIIHEVFQYSNGEFGFKEVCRLNAKYKNLQLGAHTFNSYKGIFVIDAHGYCNPLLARIAKLFM